MKLAIATQVLGWILPVVLGPIVYILAREVLNAHRKIDDLPPAFKRVAVVALGSLVAAVLNVLEIAPPPECVSDAATEACAQALNVPTVVRGATASAVAMILHALKKSRPDT